jgi:hypothetical protein
MTQDELLRMQCFDKARDMERHTANCAIPGGANGRAEFVMVTAERLYRFIKSGEMPSAD